MLYKSIHTLSNRVLVFYICYDIFISNEFLGFFWNMFNFKAVKIYKLLPVTHKATQWASID